MRTPIEHLIKTQDQKRSQRPTKERPWFNQKRPSSSKTSFASRMRLISRTPVSQWWKVSTTPMAPPSVYLSFQVVTVNPQAPVGTTSKSMIPTVSVGSQMKTVHPFITFWWQVTSTTVSSQQPLRTPIWIRHRHPTHQQILLELCNPFHVEPRLLTHPGLRIVSTSHLCAFP